MHYSYSFTFSACKKDNLNSVGKSTVPMHSVIQNSKGNYISFKFDMPENWKSYQKDNFVVQAFYAKYLEIEHIDILKELSIILYVSNYEEPLFIFDENKKMYNDLFNGNPNTYKENTQCFRNDIPQYLVTGDIDESLDLSSGDIAFWVMDSLEVTEHFKIKDGNIQKEKE